MSGSIGHESITSLLNEVKSLPPPQPHLPPDCVQQIDLLFRLPQVLCRIALEQLRLLRESGFIEVDVTMRSADGGIDGHGIIRINGLISFPVLFQCKRYRDVVSSPTVRDFRGAMIGRADKGIIITTGSFTRDARAEATRDGAPPVDLIDGDLLMDKLKELGLGVTTRMVEEVVVEEDWFQAV